MQGRSFGEGLEGQIEQVSTDIQSVEEHEVEGAEAEEVLRQSRDALESIKEDVSGLTEQAAAMAEQVTTGECREDVPFAALRPVLRDKEIVWECTHNPPHRVTS